MTNERFASGGNWARRAGMQTELRLAKTSNPLKGANRNGFASHAMGTLSNVAFMLFIGTTTEMAARATGTQAAKIKTTDTAKWAT